MFKGFFLITILTSVILWYLYEYHTEKFLAVVQTTPQLAPLVTNFRSYFGDSNFKTTRGEKIFTPDELKQYDGKKGSKGLYISILGRIFDVQKGKRHYGPGGAYHVFAGRDASRSFISGDFTGTITDDVLDLSHKELLSLKDWLNFFESEYIYVGKLFGRYYDDKGKKTRYSKDLDVKFNEAEKKQKSKENDEKQFPPCNVEWTAEKGSRVWCSKKSGGIERNWVGVPRKLYKVGSGTFRCACIDLTQMQNPDSVQYARRGHIQEYEGCNSKEISCFVKT